jgi:site-specific recombinase XerC
MHDLPLSAEDRATLLHLVREQPARDRLLAELVFGHELSLGDVLSIRADRIAWAPDHVKLVTHPGKSHSRTVTVDRETVVDVLGERRQGPLFATASGVPIRADYASRLLARVGEAAGVPARFSARRLRSKRAVVSG